MQSLRLHCSGKGATFSSPPLPPLPRRR
ncbi:unnamed protein product [Spirodela intermedia]|uniref:Uncharacterized protein n=1 Tax=Spirodela intermedia TaxID=51605 RepID=A0A7I8LK95_SPIIN|nr:unnamed protein product [Spirodela intermedia]